MKAPLFTPAELVAATGGRVVGAGGGAPVAAPH